MGKAQLHLHDITHSSPNTGHLYDAITIMDVLEHLRHPQTALRHLRNILSPKGIIIASVPISPMLFCSRDVYVGHYKRYTIQELRSLFQESGYRVVVCGAFFSYLFLPAFLLRRVLFPILKMSGQQIENIELITIPLLNMLLIWIGAIETLVASRYSLPIGTSAFCVAVPIPPSSIRPE